ncbi:hypothetical protein XENTR_v10019525 [Xenopus tropicalis]|nr:hypothetical protein XENTR_v10019525 [Xenopus tropicalis]
MESSTPSSNVSDSPTDASSGQWISEETLFYWTRAMSITCFSLTFVLGILGNGLVIWITGFQMRKTMTTTWFLNLGISDFSFCLFLPLYITEAARWGNWPFGQIMCKVTYFTTGLNQCASLLFLATISMDRCICVLYPIRSRSSRTATLAAIISVIIWLLSVALSFPYIFFTDIQNSNNFSVCFLTNGSLENITTIHEEMLSFSFPAIVISDFVFTFLIPFPIILVCYGLIAFTVRKSKRIPESFRTLKIILTTVLCFFFCWVLYHVLPVIDIAGHYMPWPRKFFLYSLAECLAFSNTCLNPIIYVFIARDFQQSLKKSIPFLLESTFKEKNDTPEVLEDNNVL